MGEGDAKLLLFVGAFTGWQGVLFAIAAGSIQGIVVAVISLASRKPLAPEEHAADDGPGNVRAKEPPKAKCVDVGGPVMEAKVGNASASAREEEAPKDGAPEPTLRLRLPFGPLLALAALEWLFFGDRVVEWYLGLFEV
jgi:leader peptidase (prepilin peptidase)/N-methyltransferase